MHEGQPPRSTVEPLVVTLNQVALDILVAETGAAALAFASSAALHYLPPPDALRHAHRALIDPRKLTDYALNPHHPAGGAHKARAFQSALGFHQSNYRDLLRQLQTGVTRYPAYPGRVDQYGQRFTVET